MIYAIDFDGTLCEAIYPGIGEPKLEVIQKVKELKEQGNILILWTCRRGKALRDAINWCKQFDLYFDRINRDYHFAILHRKIFADFYIDDKAVKPLEIIS